MIVQESLHINNVDFTKSYSDAGMMIRSDHDGNLYEDALDPTALNRTYTETDTPIDAEEGDYIEALESLGVNLNEEE